MGNRGTDRIILQTSLSPDIKINRINGSLRIRGWDRAEIRADSSEADTLSASEKENIIEISCQSGCVLRVPVDSTITVEEVTEELMLKSLENKLEANLVEGQVLAKSIGDISLKKVKGNINAKYIEGNFSCDSSEGNINIQDVEGKVIIANNKNNISLRGFFASIDANTSGNASIGLDPKPGGDYKIKAGGNIQCRLEPDTSAKVSLQSGSGMIKIDAFGAKDTINAKEHQIEIGDGDGRIILEAKGTINLIAPLEHESSWGFEFDMDEEMSSLADDISQVVSEQIKDQMNNLTKHINQITSQFPSSQIEERTMKNLEAKRKTLERKLARVEQRSIQRAQRTQKKISYSARRYGRITKPAGDPVTDQERQKVLEMLQNQQISVADAEILLSALEGKSPKKSED